MMGDASRSVSQGLIAKRRLCPLRGYDEHDDFRLSLSASYHRLVRHDTPTKTCTWFIPELTKYPWLPNSLMTSLFQRV
jgi:hypothetical protein